LTNKQKALLLSSMTDQANAVFSSFDEEEALTLASKSGIHRHSR